MKLLRNIRAMPKSSLLLDPVVAATIVATAVIVVVLIYAVKRSNGLTEYISKEEELTREVKLLRKEIDNLIRKHSEEVANLKRDILALQGMLLDKAKDNSDLLARITELERLQNGKPKPKQPADKKPSLVLAAGQDKMLQIDVARLRGIKKLQLSVLQDATRKDVEAIIEERRSQGRPIKYLHFATHSGPEGVLFADGLADSVWLSQTLKDVQVLLIAGCKSHRVASILSVVSFVVSMRDDIDNADASTFSYHFWFAIGEGYEPEEAYYYAIERSNAVVSEMAEFHSY